MYRKQARGAPELSAADRAKAFASEYERELNHARTAMRDGDPRGARAILSGLRRRAMRVGQKNWVDECTYLMSLAAGAAGDHETELEDARRLAKSRGTRSDYLLLAEVLRRSGRPRAARNAEQRATECDEAAANEQWPAQLGRALGEVSRLMETHPQLIVTIGGAAYPRQADSGALLHVEVPLPDVQRLTEMSALVKSSLPEWAERRGSHVTVTELVADDNATSLTIVVRSASL